MCAALQDAVCPGWAGDCGEMSALDQIREIDRLLSEGYTIRIPWDIPGLFISEQDVRIHTIVCWPAWRCYVISKRFYDDLRPDGQEQVDGWLDWTRRYIEQGQPGRL